MSPLTRLRTFIIDHYNLADLEILCQAVGVRFDNLGGDNRLDVKANRLVHTLGLSRRYEPLLAELRRTRSEAFIEKDLDDLTAAALQAAFAGYAAEQVPVDVPAGEQILPRYEQGEELGRGSFAVVYKARDTELDRTVALKILHPYWHETPKFARRFRLEAQTTAGLRHPNIVGVYDWGQDEQERLFIVMEYLPGRTLQAYLEDHPVLTLEQALPILQQVAEALDYAHAQGVVHRDLKPGNIMVEERESGLKVTLMDFGLVKAMEGTLAKTMTIQNTNLGSPEYMAPEQVESSRKDEIGPAADRYALGVLAYRLLVGQVPFSGDSLWSTLYSQVHEAPTRPTVFVPYLDVGVETVLLKMLAKEIEKRWGSCWGNQWKEGCCNTKEAGIGGTTPIGRYSPDGDSPYGCVDMSGNVWERLHNSEDQGWYRIKGGSWKNERDLARAFTYDGRYVDPLSGLIGFRVVVEVPFS